MKRIGISIQCLFLLAAVVLVSSCEEFEIADENGYEICVSGNIVAMSTNNGCKLWDVSNPSDAELLSAIKVGYTAGVLIKGSVLYVSAASALYAFDISIPGSPEQIGSISCAMGSLYALDNRLFLKGSDNVVIINIENPQSMTILDEHRFASVGYGSGIFAEDGYIYATNGYLWQLKYDLNGQISDPVNITDNAWGLKSDGNYIYLTTYGWGIKIVDITDHEKAHTESGLDCGEAWDLTFSEGYLYVSDQHAGVKKIDITDINHPVQVLKSNDKFCAHGISFDSGFVFCAGGSHGFFILDTSDLSATFN